MRFLRGAFAVFLLGSPAFAATFGTAVPVVGGASDIVLDEARGLLYLVTTAQGQVQVYSIAQKAFLTPVATDKAPLSAALSRSGKYLYVTASGAATLDVIDLDAMAISTRVILPAQPEGVAVGGDERVLISTIGTGAGNASNVLLVYDPNAAPGPRGASVVSVPITPPAAQSPLVTPPSGRPFLAGHSQLRASPDGSIIVGSNLPGNNSTVVFVYEVASGTVLLSRSVTSASNVLAVAPDNSKFMAGLTLFDVGTLQVLAQQNLANAPYPINAGTNFNTQSNQGGSVFAPDGSVLYSDFDVSPLQNPPAPAEVSQLMFSDPSNLLIQLALQLPENLAGKMAIDSGGRVIYALSDSGFTIIPVGNTFKNPIAAIDTNPALLLNDQCGVTSAQHTQRIAIRNAGAGRLSASAQLLQAPALGPGGLGGTIIGAGGGFPGGGGVIIVLPGGGVAGGGGGGGLNGGGGAFAQGLQATAPSVRPAQTPGGPAFDFTFNPMAAQSLGTISGGHQFLIQSPEAINIPPEVQVFQNNRNAEARGTLVPVPIGISANEGLTDLVYDAQRQRVYLSNAGLNRVEVYDIGQQQLLAPITVGQLPQSMALSPDGNTLYVANSGGENISIVDPGAMKVVGTVVFPPLPFNSTVSLLRPSVVAAGLGGLLVVMNDGSQWSVIGNTAVPRPVSGIVGTTSAGRPLLFTAPFTMASTPNGEYIIVLSGNGMVYLYDALADNFVQSRQVFTNPIQGYFGPITAGPHGQYYVVNGVVLNQALTPVSQSPSAPNGTTTVPVPIAAVAQVGPTTYARFTQPVRTSTTAPPSGVPTVDIVSASATPTGPGPGSGFPAGPLSSFPALEGPTSTVAGTARANVAGRTMAIDSSGTTAYLLTTTGLSVIPLTATPASNRPQVFSKGVVDAVAYQSKIAQNGLISVFGQNLAASAMGQSTPLSTVLGGVCVTLNNTPLPLFMTSAGQINAQVPPALAAASYSLTVRSIANNIASQSQSLTISKYAPAVVVDPVSGQTALLHADGRYVTKDNPANRDEHLTLYATGLGLPVSGAAPSGTPQPASPLALTQTVSVYFGNPGYKQAAIIVDFSGLAPGFIGLYQLNLRIPGFHISGDALPVTIKVGGVSSSTGGPVAPLISVN
ncbi:MAG: beta-propeller fold lactonase family protein [Bryobacteraceae bacterium]